MLGLAEDTGILAILAQLEEPQANGQSWLKDEQQMLRVARLDVDAAARNPGALDQLLRTTREVADRCALDPAADIGLGTPRLPGASIIRVEGDPVAELWRRARHGERGWATGGIQTDHAPVVAH